MIAVIREESPEHAQAVANALLDAGAPVIEVTFTTPGALDLISDLSRQRELLVAAGTVLSENDVAKARRAGAQLIVSPHYDHTIVSATLNAGLLSIAGAATATEVLAAHHAGAHIIKVYPARFLGGPAFIRTIRQPIRRVEMLAGGPVEIDEIEEYLAAGCIAVNLGGSLAPAEAVRAGDWEQIRRNAARAVAITTAQGKSSA